MSLLKRKLAADVTNFDPVIYEYEKLIQTGTKTSNKYGCRFLPAMFSDYSVQALMSANTFAGYANKDLEINV